FGEKNVLNTRITTCVLAIAGALFIGSQAIGGTTVTIDGPLPLPVTTTESQPVQGVTGLIGAPANGVANTPNVVLYTVPAGKRLIVEHFSSKVDVVSGVAVSSYNLGAAVSPDAPPITGPNFSHSIPPASNTPCSICGSLGGSVSVASQP